MITLPCCHSSTSKARLLIVGDLAVWRRSGRDWSSCQCVTYSNPSDVTKPFLQVISPDVVVSAVVGFGYDAIDIAKRLSDAGYRGRYRCIAAAVPDHTIIQQEVAQSSPSVDFAIITPDDFQSAH